MESVQEINPKKKSFSRGALWLFAAVCFAALFNLETSPFRYIVPSRPFSECLKNQLAGDTYVYLYVGNLIPQGKMPYRDMFDHKGPLLYLMMALGIRTGKIAGVWLLQTACLFVSAFYAYKTSRLLASRRAAFLAAGLAVMWYSLGETGPDTFSVPFLLISLYFFTRYLLNGYQISARETVFTGICFAAVALLKINLVALWLVFVLTVIVVSAVRKEWLLLLERTLLFLLGAAAVAGPVFAWLYAKGAFPDFVKVYWHFNLYHYGTPAPLSNYLTYFCPPLCSLTPTSLVHWLLYFWFNTPAVVLYLFLVRKTRSPAHQRFYVLMTVYFFLALRLVGARHWIFIYYCFPLTAAYLPFFAVSFDYLLRLFRRRRVAAVLLFLLLTVPVLHTLCIPVLRDWAERAAIAKIFPEIDLQKWGVPIRFDRPALELADWIRENTPQGASMNGIGFQVYWYAQRLCASSCFPEPGQKPFAPRLEPDENGVWPDYYFVCRRREVRLGRLIGKSKREGKPVEVDPKIEKALAEKYTLVYRNGAYDLYKRLD